MKKIVNSIVSLSLVLTFLLTGAAATNYNEGIMLLHDGPCRDAYVE